MPAIETATQTDPGIEFGQIPERNGTTLRYNIRTHTSPADAHKARIEAGQQVLDLPMTASEVIRVPSNPPIQQKDVFNNSSSTTKPLIPEAIPIPIFTEAEIVLFQLNLD